MFLKLEKRKNKDGSTRKYLYIAKAIREGKKVINKNVMSLGRLDVLAEGNTFENLTRKFAAFSEKLEVLNLEENLDGEAVKDLGMIWIYKELWKKLEFDKVLNKYYEDREVKFDIQETIFSLVANRLEAPSSKREASRWKEEVYMPEWEGIELHHMYRAMDYLVEKKSKFETELFNRGRTLFNLEVDLIMFDTTTVSSWGEGAHGELLKHHGKPKNKRPDLKQICVGVLMTKEGIPVGHEVWEGPKSDKTSFVEIIDKVRENFKIGRVIFVCDKGMVSQKNIKYLEANGYEYILGSKMRRIGKDNEKEFLGPEGFEAAIRTEKKHLDVKEVVRTQIVRIDNEEREIKKRYIICYNPAEAKKDAAKRAKFKEVLKQKTADSTLKSWIVKNGYKKYVEFQGENIKLVVNEKMIDEEKIYDGKWILVTNTDLDSADAVRSYKGLSKIEAGFRDLKSEIEIDPFFHWTTKRIRAHVFICFLALVLKLGFEKKLKELDQNIDVSEVIRNVNRMKVSELKLNDKIVHLRTNLQGNAHIAFRAIGARVPDKILYTSKSFSSSFSSENVVGTPVDNCLF